MMVGPGARRRTILLVDADPHARAILRQALEAEGFSVGEAVNGAEGERTAMRVRPDAILADLLIETPDAARLLGDLGARIPIYIVSTAADALVGSVGLHELGVSGVFLKPADPAVVARTLKTRLGLG